MPIIEKEMVPPRILNMAEHVRKGAIQQAPKSKAEYSVTPTCYMVITRNDETDKVIRGKVLSLADLSTQYMRTVAKIHMATRLIQNIARGKAVDQNDELAGQLRDDLMNKRESVDEEEFDRLLASMVFHTMVVCECWFCVDQEFLKRKKDGHTLRVINENEYEIVHEEQVTNIPKNFDKGFLVHIVMDDDEGAAHHYFFMHDIVRETLDDGTHIIKDIKLKYIYKAANGENVSFSFGTKDDIAKGSTDSVQLSRKEAHLEVEDLLRTMFLSECQIADFENVHTCATKALTDAFEKDTLAKSVGSFDHKHNLNDTVMIVSGTGQIIEFGEVLNWSTTHAEAIASMAASMYGHNLRRQLDRDLGKTERKSDVDPVAAVMIEEVAKYPITEEDRDKATEETIIEEVLLVVEVDNQGQVRFFYREIFRAEKKLGPLTEIDANEEPMDSDYRFVAMIKQQWREAQPEIEMAKVKLHEGAEKHRRHERGEESAEELSEELHKSL